MTTYAVRKKPSEDEKKIEEEMEFWGKDEKGAYGHWSISCCNIGCRIAPPDGILSKHYKNIIPINYRDRGRFTFYLSDWPFMDSLYRQHKEEDDQPPAAIICLGWGRKFEITLEKAKIINSKVSELEQKANKGVGK